MRSKLANRSSPEPMAVSCRKNTHWLCPFQSSNPCVDVLLLGKDKGEMIEAGPETHERVTTVPYLS